MDENLDDLMEKTTVQFTSSLTLERTELFLQEVARVLEGGVDYDTRRGNHVRYDEEEQRLVQVPGSIEMTGTIYDKRRESTSFRALLDDQDDRAIQGLRFGCIPGYSLSEHRKSQVALWERIQTIARKYLAQQTVAPLPPGENWWDD